jgi:acyl-CoA thioester hydrolase
MADQDKIFTTAIDVRWADLDAYAHVNGTTYFTYMETARVLFYESIGLDCLYGPVRTFIARSECDYRLAIGSDDKVQVDIVVSRVGNTSLDLLYKLHDAKGQTFATGKTVMVTVDAETAQPVAVPECFREIVNSSVDFS